MKRPLLWIVAGVLAAGLLGFGLAEALAQRGDGPRPAPGAPGFGGFGGFGIGRFQFVKTDGSDIILLDTATGELYAATKKDIKPHKEIPRPEAIRPDRPDREDRPPRDKDDARPARDKPPADKSVDKPSDKPADKPFDKRDEKRDDKPGNPKLNL